MCLSSLKSLALISILVVSLAGARPVMAINVPNSSSRIPSEEWNMTFGGLNDDVGTFVQETRDGGYIVVGYTASFGADSPYSWLIKSQLRGDLWLIKTDSLGNVEWEKTLGGFGREFGFCVQETDDGGYIMTGAKKPSWFANYDLWIVKTDSKGIVEWEKLYGGSREDLGFSICQTTDGGYIATGYRSFSPGKKLYIVKTNSSGDMEWERLYGGVNTAEGSCIQQTSDGGYIVTGYYYISSKEGPKEDLWLLKLDSSGFNEWDKTFGGAGRDIGLYVSQTDEGGYIVTGLTESYGSGGGDVWLIKTDPRGNIEWDTTFGGIKFDQGTAVHQTADGGYIIAGFNSTLNIPQSVEYFLFKPSCLSRVWLIKTDSTGKMEWDLAFGGPSNDWGNSMQETSDGGYILAGVTESYGAGKSDVWLIKVR